MSLNTKDVTADSVEWFANGTTTGQTGATYTAGMVSPVYARILDGSTEYLTPPVKILHEHDTTGHNVSDDAVMALIPHEDATHIAVADGNWTDPTIWDVGAVPSSGAVVLISIGRTVTYDSTIAPRLDRGVAVVKASGDQDHDLNIKIANFVGWGLYTYGINLNYIGAYLLQDIYVVRSRFSQQVVTNVTCWTTRQAKQGLR